MSLNQIVLTESKPWANIRANNLKINGNLSMRGGAGGYALSYHGPDNIKFSPLVNIQDISFDEFYMTPILNAAPTTIDFIESPTTPLNFSIDVNDDLVCDVAGTYLFTYKFVQDNDSNNSAPLLNFSVNNLVNPISRMRQPLCKPPQSSIPTHAGQQATFIVVLAENDVIKMNLAMAPSPGVVTMVNVNSASNLIIVKLS